MKEPSTKIKEVRMIAKHNDGNIVFHTIYNDNGQVVFTYRGAHEHITEREDTIDLYLPLIHATRLFYNSGAISNFYSLAEDANEGNTVVNFFSSLFLGEVKPNGFL